MFASNYLKILLKKFNKTMFYEKVVNKEIVIKIFIIFRLF